MFEGGSTKKVQTVSGIVLLVVVIMLMAVYYLWLTSRDEDGYHGPIMVSRSAVSPEEAGESTAYTDTEQGFVVRSTAGWGIERSVTGAGDMTIPTTVFSKAGESVSVYVVPENDAMSVREMIEAGYESDTTVCGIEGAKLEGVKSGSETPVHLILVNSGGKTYGIAGFGKCLDEFIGTFEIL